MGVKRTKGKVPEKGINITNINVRVPNRGTQNIESWRSAISAFENRTNPIRAYLYDLYKDIELDGQVIATWGKRCDAITNKRLLFKRDGEEDERITALLNSPDMRLIVKELLKSIAYGFTLIYIDRIYFDEDEEQYKMDWDLIPRKHVHPEKGFECVSCQQNMATRDFLFMDKHNAGWMVWAGERDDMGLFSAVAQYVIYKRGGFGDWSQFAEMFGMPFRELSYDDYDPETRAKLEKAMEDWGAAGYIIKPKSAELTLHDTGGSTSSAEVYDMLISKCDAAISKVILGNTLTTEQGEVGSQALGEVHKESETEKNASDQLFILSVLNTKFRAVLKKFGFDVTGGEIMYEGLETNWDKVQTKWNVVKEIRQTVPVDDDFIYEEFDIPKPDNYEQMKEEMRQNMMMPGFNVFGDDVINPDITEKPRNSLITRLKNFFA